MFEGVTTGTPVSLLIRNEDQRSKDYGEIKDALPAGPRRLHLRREVRPARLPRRRPLERARDGLRGSRPAPSRARCSGPSIRITGYLVQIGADFIDRDRLDLGRDRAQPVLVPGRRGRRALGGSSSPPCARRGSSVGAVIEVVASGVPAGLGEPIYDKLDADLAKAMMSINAVKGVEIGAGFAAAALRGEDNADEIRMGNDGPRFLSNHAGGILGGISSGQDIVVRFAVKPTSSILTPRRTIDRHGNETEIVTKGRHDPCVGIRAVPVGEAMMACVLADHLLRHRGDLRRALSQAASRAGWPQATRSAAGAHALANHPRVTFSVRGGSGPVRRQGTAAGNDNPVHGNGSAAV